MVFEWSFCLRAVRSDTIYSFFLQSVTRKDILKKCFSFPFWLGSTIIGVHSPWTFHATSLCYSFLISWMLLMIPFFTKYSTKTLNERWNTKLFKSGERLKSCRVKLPFKGTLTNWKNLMKLNKGKRRALCLWRSIPMHLCSLVADEVESHWVV